MLQLELTLGSMNCLENKTILFKGVKSWRRIDYQYLQRPCVLKTAAAAAEINLSLSLAQYYFSGFY